MEKQRSRIDMPVFVIAAGISVVFVLVGVLFKDDMAVVVGDILSWVLTNLGWLFVLSTAAFLIFVLFLGVTPYGRIRLGKDDDRPEFRTVSWIAMMFSAGMGIGLMFFGVAEPISHLAAPPLGLAKPGTEAAAATAMEYTYFHWALHPWALYAVVGLALGYFCFRKGYPNLISTVFRPLLGDRVDGPIGKGIDILAIFATMFGSATSLGLGALQINSGLDFVWGVETSTGLAVVIISVLTLLFVVSAVSGGTRRAGSATSTWWWPSRCCCSSCSSGPPCSSSAPSWRPRATTSAAWSGAASGPGLRRRRVAGQLDDLLLGLVDVLDAVRGHLPRAISKGPDIREFVIGVLLIPSGVTCGSPSSAAPRSTWS